MTNEAPQPAPSGLGAVLAIVQTVVAIVPRWLVVAAGVVFVSWLGFDLFINGQMKLEQLKQERAKTTSLISGPMDLPAARERAERIKREAEAPKPPALSEADKTEMQERIDAARAAAKAQYIRDHGLQGANQ